MTEPMMSPDELAERLGVTKRAVYRLVDLRLIPFVKVGKRLRFERADVEAYIAKNRHETMETTIAMGGGFRHR